MSEPLPLLSGPIALLPTFFGSDGVDIDAQLTHCRRLRASCRTALAGTAEGEGPTLNPHERDTVILAALRAGLDLVGMAICTPSTRAAITQARQAEAAGAGFLAVTPPPYNKPTRDGVVAHAQAIAEASRLPIIMRDEPGRTRSGLTDEALAQLCRVPGVGAIALAPGDIRRRSLVDHESRGRLQALCGTDFDAVLGQCDERCAWLSSAVNVDPERCLDMQRARLSGDLRTSARLSRELCRLLRALELDEPAVTVKHAFSRMMDIDAVLRLPLVPLGAESAATLDAALDTLNLIGRSWSDRACAAI